MSSSADDLIIQMEKFKNDFYEREQKNNFFKKSQKLDCARKLSQNFEFEEMMQKTMFAIPGTNKLVFDYSVFKLYANPNNYNAIVDYAIGLYDFILLQFPTFEIHIILESFSISAAERYKSIIQAFCMRCMTAEAKYSKLITTMYIYYTPSMVESINTLLRPFIDKDIGTKIVLYSKAESPDCLKKLLL